MGTLGAEKKTTSFQILAKQLPVTLTSVMQALLLGILFDTQLTSNAHVFSLCKKANFQLLTLKRLATCMDVKTKLTILQSFIRSNFTYCCHIWYLFSYSQGKGRKNSI